MKNTKEKITKALENINLIEKRLKEILNNLNETNKKEARSEVKMINYNLLRILNNEIIVNDFEKKYNVGIATKELINGDIKYKVHGHSSTEADSAIEAIINYLK